MADINTVVNGNAATCRQAADWLAKADGGIEAGFSAASTTQSRSESCWQGSAADGFRAHVGQVGSDAMQLSLAAGGARQALSAFAADLDTVNARMAQARSVASAAGLTVTQTTIRAPGPAPTRRTGPVTGQEATEFYQAQAAYNTKLSAFNEAQTTVSGARQVESQAHRNLTGPMQNATTMTQNLVTISSTATGIGLSILGNTQDAASDLYDDADDITAHAQRMEQLALDSDLTDAGRAAAARSGMLASAGAAETSEEAASIEKAVNKVPAPIRDFIAKNPGDLVEDSSGLLKLGQAAAKNLPYVGTGATILFGGLEVLDGSETPTQAIAETGLSLAGGAVGAMAGSELGAAAGSVIPIVGTAAGGIIGGIVGGIIGSISGGKAGDQFTGAH